MPETPPPPVGLPPSGTPAAPVETVVNVAVVPAVPESVVALAIDTPTGRFVVFLNADAAGKIADELADKARECKTGLSIVSNGGVPILGVGHNGVAPGPGNRAERRHRPER